MTRNRTPLLAAAVVAGLMASFCGQTAAAAPSEAERYLDLLERKRLADLARSALTIEDKLSAKKKAYAVLDLSDRKILFKIRGRTFKALPLSDLRVRSGAGGASPLFLAGKAYTLQIKEGKGVETESIDLKNMTPEERELAGGAPSEGGGGGAVVQRVDQGTVSEGAARSGRTAGTGAAPTTQKMAGVAGGSIPPDPPPRYHLGFDGNLSIWVVADETVPAATATYARLLALAKAIGRFFRGAEGHGGETKVELRCTLDRCQQLFRQILCGQQLLVVP